MPAQAVSTYQNEMLGGAMNLSSAFSPGSQDAHNGNRCPVFFP
jgi:hypothetical protein